MLEFAAARHSVSALQIWPHDAVGVVVYSVLLLCLSPSIAGTVTAVGNQRIIHHPNSSQPAKEGSGVNLVTHVWESRICCDTRLRPFLEKRRIERDMQKFSVTAPRRCSRPIETLPAISCYPPRADDEFCLRVMTSHLVDSPTLRGGES